MSTVPLTSIDGDHVLAIAVVALDPAESYYISRNIEVYGVVLRSSIAAFVNQSFSWNCPISPQYDNLLRNFIENAYIGKGNYLSFCLTPDKWCENASRNRVTVAARVALGNVRFSKPNVGVVNPPEIKAVINRTIVDPEMNRWIEIDVESNIKIEQNHEQAYSRDLDFDDDKETK